MRQFVLSLLAITLFAAFAVACEEKGPMEKAGENVDEAVNDAKRKVEDATD